MDLLSTLTTALESAGSVFPNDNDQFLPPSDGISLLDIKNDILLSYLQNLAFIVILKLRNDNGDGDGAGAESPESLWAEAIKNLVELRVVLERGVRPLESKLKYQIDKVVRAAEEADRRTAQKSVAGSQQKQGLTTKALRDSDASESGSEDLNDDEEVDQLEGDMDGDRSVGPRPAALLRNAEIPKGNPSSTASRHNTSGAYKPPRITPTSMPNPASAREHEQPARKRKSQLLDEYIDEEMSSTPRAQPSIGSNSTIINRGRGAVSARDRDKERERVDYEERNFTRLPGESKAEKKKARQRGERNARDMFGGEDWTGLGGLGDRIHRNVAGRARGEGGSVLERRQKRQRDTQDGPRGDGAGGVGIGDSFEKRRKILQQRSEKKSRRKA